MELAACGGQPGSDLGPSGGKGTRRSLEGLSRSLQAAWSEANFGKVVRFGIKMLAVPGVAVLKCHPYRQIPIVIHGFCLRHHLSVSTLTFGASSRMLALTRVLV